LTEVPVLRDRVETSDRAKPLELMPPALSDLLIVSIQEISARIEPATGLALPRRKEAHAKAQATPAMHDMPTVPLATHWLQHRSDCEQCSQTAATYVSVDMIM
jgi:hypothetical protein